MGSSYVGALIKDAPCSLVSLSKHPDDYRACHRLRFCLSGFVSLSYRYKTVVNATTIDVGIHNRREKLILPSALCCQGSGTDRSVRDIATGRKSKPEIQRVRLGSKCFNYTSLARKHCPGKYTLNSTQGAAEASLRGYRQ